MTAPSSRMAESPRTIWEVNSPDSLLDLSARFCVLNTQTFTKLRKDGHLELQDGMHLPAEIGEKLFHISQEEGIDLNDKFAHIFKDTQTSRVRQLSVRDSSLTDNGMQYLVGHNLRELDIHNCAGLTVQTLHNINRHSDHLHSLCIGNSVQILPDYLHPDSPASDSESDNEKEEESIYEKQGYIIKAKMLRRLCVRDLFVNRGPKYFDLLLKPLPGLTHLDLSGAFHNQGMSELKWLLHCRNLVSLTLHNVRDVESSLSSLRLLSNIRHLDVSQCDDQRGDFRDPTHFLESIVESLTHLTSLDISGTNLGGLSGERGGDGVLCDIAGLAGRIDSPLEFLGLYKSQHDACTRQHIPAKTISGDSCEAQILVAGQRYLDRPNVLESILNDLFHVFRYETCQNLRDALDILLLAMERHNHEKHIQISGSASLYYVVKSEQLKRDMNVKVKRKILGTLLNGMLAHRNDPTMMRNGCLTLCQFQIPQDVLFDYERLVRILLHIVSEHKSEEHNFVQRAGIYLLNSLACQVDGQQKLLVGNLGAMEKMLNIITEKLHASICDDVMETAWSAMWNVTDETPVNCERFLNGSGMYLFLKCKERFPEKADLLRNMMGLLGNVAEVPELRHKLMTKEFVEEFSFLLDSNSDGIEVSYNAAGVLAHMASDGPTAWTVAVPDRELVLERMVRAISRWNLETKRNINYRSFEPIIRLLRVSHTSECQLWAIWALANLTKVDAGKYCRLVEEEGGLALIEEMLNHNSDTVTTSQPRVRELAQVVRSNVLRWKEEGKDDSLHLEFDG